MSTALEDTRLNAAGPVGYLVGGNMGNSIVYIARARQ